MCRLIKIQRDMGLPLMVGLMPGEDVQDVEEGELAFLEGFGDVAEVDVLEGGQGFQQVLAGLVEDAADFVEGGDVLVRRAAPLEPGHEISPGGRFRRGQPLGGEELFGDANMHELPGDVGASWAGTPGENLHRVFVLGNAVERQERAGTEKAHRVDHAVNTAHFRGTFLDFSRNERKPQVIIKRCEPAEQERNAKRSNATQLQLTGDR